MKVWLVERKGVEEDYTVAVFSTKALALVFIDDQKDFHMYDFWEIEVDRSEK